MLLSVIALTMVAQPCAKPPALPRELRGWSRTGQGIDTRHATLLTPRDGRAESRMTIRKSGVFGIAIDREGWIDVATPRGRTLRMVSESRGPRCSGIRKIVRYRLRPGDYRVRVANLGAPQVKLMLTHVARR